MNRRHSYHLLVLSVVVLAVYGWCLRFGFVWDDTVLTIGNPVYRDFQLGTMLTSPANGLEYLPLRDLTYAVDYALWGERAAGFHLTNLLLFLGNVAAVYLLVRRLAPAVAGGSIDTDTAAFGTALLFAVHPIQCEAVNFITCRNVLLSGLCFFTAVSCWLHFLAADDGRPWRWYAVSLVLFLAALLSKATAIVLPLVLLACVAVTGGTAGLRRRLLPLVPFFLLAGAFFQLFRRIGSASGVIAAGGEALTDNAVLQKLAVALQIPWFYLGKLLVPLGFSVAYTRPFARDLHQLPVLLALAGLLVVTAGAVRLRRRYPELLFGLLWYGVALLPVLNLFRTRPVVADRYAYLATFGVMFALATWAARFTATRRWLRAAGLLLAVCWMALAVNRSRVWADEETLWTATIRTSPEAVNPYLNLGQWYFNAGQYDRAFAQFARTRELNAAVDYVSYFRGLQLRSRGDRDGALREFRRAEEYNENSMAVLYELGNLYAQAGDDDRAVRYYNRIIALDGLDVDGVRPKARAALAGVLPRIAPQLDALRSRIARDPADLQALGELALRLDQLGFLEEALQRYRELLARGVQSWQLAFNAGNAAKKLGRYGAAADYYEQSLRLNPAHADALVNLGVVRRMLGQLPPAVDAFRRALAIDGSSPPAYFNLAITYYRQGDRERAAQLFRETRTRFPALAHRVTPYLQLLEGGSDNGVQRD